MGMRPHSHPGTRVVSRGGQERGRGTDRLPRAVCARDGTELHTDIRTDGSGQLREVVEPCPTCAQHNKEVGRQFRTVEILCRGCGETFRHALRRGRPPAYCPDCAPETRDQQRSWRALHPDRRS